MSVLELFYEHVKSGNEPYKKKKKAQSIHLVTRCIDTKKEMVELEMLT